MAKNPGTALDTSSVTATGGIVGVSATDRSTLSASSSITVSSTASAGGAASALSGDYSFTDKSGDQTVKKGDQVYVSGTVYTYLGNAQTPDTGDSLNLGGGTGTATDYADTKLWQKGGDGSASTDASNAESKAVGAVFVLNDVRGDAYAEINVAATITGGAGISVRANEAASISAVTQSNLTSTGGGNGSKNGNTTSGGGLAIGGAIDTNLVLGNAQASIQGATLNAGASGVVVDAEDTSQLNAETLVASSTGGGGSQTAFGLSIAFNSIGYAPENFLFNVIDDLVGGTYLSNPIPDNATAFVKGVTVTGDTGGFSVTAESSEQVNATVSNAATSTTSDLYDASSNGFGGVFASNKVDGSAIAYIDGTGMPAITATGALVVTATDGSGIFSNVKLVSAAIVSSDGGTGTLAWAVANGASNPTYSATPSNGAPNMRTLNAGDTVQLGVNYDTVDFTVGTTASTTQALTPGDVIQDGATLYRYVGSGGTFDLTTDAAITADPADFKVIGGTAGAIYAYIGSAPATLDLNDTDYTGADWATPKTYYSAPTTGISNTQSLNPGDRVSVEAGYLTAAYTVGASPATNNDVTLNPGDVIADAANFYRYVGASKKSNVDLTNDTAITSDPTDFVQIGGQQSQTYVYIGAAGTSVDLNASNYADTTTWRPATAYLAPTSAGGATNTQALYYGDTVALPAGYDAVNYTVGSSPSNKNVTINPGDVIADVINSVTTLYRYIGTSHLTGVNLSTDASITGNANFTVIGGQEGQTYQYLGAPAASDGSATGTSVNLYDTDYTNLNYWKPVSVANAAPNGVATTPPDTSSNNSKSSPSSATAVGGVLVLNDDISATQAYVTNATINAGSATIEAIDNATIDATNDSTVVSATTSGMGKSLAVNAIIATNVLQNSAAADVVSSTITVNAGALAIDAENTATIDATTAAQTSSTGSGAAVGIVLAFNSIGYEASNVLFDAFDALLGNSTITHPGASPETNVTAYAQDSDLTASDGDVSVTASLETTIDATTTNTTSSLAAALNNSSSTSVGAILATNEISNSAQAYVTTSTTASVTASGAISILASNESTIDARDTQAASATVQKTGAPGSKDGSLLSQYANQMANGYQYTRNSGTQMVAPGQIAYDGSNYYIFLGTTGDLLGVVSGEPLAPVSIDFATVNFSGTNPSAGLWAPFTNSSLLQYAPQIAAFVSSKLSPPAGDTNSNPTAADTGTGTRSTGVGAIFVLNTINSSSIAYENDEALTSGNNAGVGKGGGITISATNASLISATNTSTVTTGQGSPTAANTNNGIAVNGIVATNNILGETQAYASGGSLTASGTSGFVDVIGSSSATIDATNSASTDGTGTAVGVVLAFNTIGVPQPIVGFLEQTVDALFGTQLAGDQPDQVYAYIDGATTTASDGVDVQALEGSTITANITNSETGLFTSGTSVAATITLNEVATDVEAWIAGGKTTATAGDIDIDAEGGSTITSTVTSPVIKLAVNFSKNQTDQNAETIGVAIARNIVDSGVSATAGQTPASITFANPAATLDAEAGNIAITADQTSAITATSEAAAVSVSASTNGSTQSFAGGGAVAINTILGDQKSSSHPFLGKVTASSVGSSLTAKGAAAGGVTVQATYGGSITATVAALAASVAVSNGASDAVAIGAAVALNLIGWNGTVADETQDFECSDHPVRQRDRRIALGRRRGSGQRAIDRDDQREDSGGGSLGRGLDRDQRRGRRRGRGRKLFGSVQVADRCGHRGAGIGPLRARAGPVAEVLGQELSEHRRLERRRGKRRQGQQRGQFYGSVWNGSGRRGDFVLGPDDFGQRQHELGSQQLRADRRGRLHREQDRGRYYGLDRERDQRLQRSGRDGLGDRRSVDQFDRRRGGGDRRFLRRLERQQGDLDRHRHRPQHDPRRRQRLCLRIDDHGRGQAPVRHRDPERLDRRDFHRGGAVRFRLDQRQFACRRRRRFARRQSHRRRNARLYLRQYAGRDRSGARRRHRGGDRHLLDPGDGCRRRGDGLIQHERRRDGRRHRRNARAQPHQRRIRPRRRLRQRLYRHIDRDGGSGFRHRPVAADDQRHRRGRFGRHIRRRQHGPCGFRRGRGGVQRDQSRRQRVDRRRLLRLERRPGIGGDGEVRHHVDRRHGRRHGYVRHHGARGIRCGRRGVRRRERVRDCDRRGFCPERHHRSGHGSDRRREVADDVGRRGAGHGDRERLDQRHDRGGRGVGRRRRRLERRCGRRRRRDRAERHRRRRDSGHHRLDPWNDDQ